MRRSLLGIVMLATAIGGGCRGAAEGNVTAVAQGTSVTIASARGTHRFTVEVARTPAEQARGLMFRDRLPDNAGMIFPFPAPRVASFWMKDVPVPLDMIFIRADGTVESIAEAQPFDLTPQTSGEPVAAVLEIRGGRAAELGIAPGDRVNWPR